MIAYEGAMYLFKKIFSRVFFPVPLSLELMWVGLILVWLRPQRQMGKWIVSFRFYRRSPEGKEIEERGHREGG